jgi:hypothetical protein
MELENSHVDMATDMEVEEKEDTRGDIEKEINAETIGDTKINQEDLGEEEEETKKIEPLETQGESPILQSNLPPPSNGEVEIIGENPPSDPGGSGNA